MGALEYIRQSRLALLLSFAVLVIYAVAKYFLVYDAESEKIDRKLGSLVDIRTNALKQYFKTLDGEIQFWSRDGTIKLTTQAFTMSWAELGENPGDVARKLYIENNPFERSRYMEYMNAEDGSSYSLIHEAIHTRARDFLEKRGYYDLFIVSNAGDVIYTVVKEDDYGTNLNTGKYKDSGLAKVYREALLLDDDSVAFQDFSPYAPSYGEPAGFMATPIKDLKNFTLGVLVFQIPTQAIERSTNRAADSRVRDVVTDREENFIIGDDDRLRSSLPLSKGKFSFFTEVPDFIPDVPEKMELDRIYRTFGLDYRDEENEYVFQKTNVLDTQWIFGIKKDTEDLYDRVFAVYFRWLLFYISVSLFAFLVAYHFIRRRTHQLEVAESETLDGDSSEEDLLT